MFGVAEADKDIGGNVSVRVAGEVASQSVTSLPLPAAPGMPGGPPTGTLVVTDVYAASGLDQDTCRLRHIYKVTAQELASPPVCDAVPEQYVVGTSDENGNLAIQPRHATDETALAKAYNLKAYGGVADYVFGGAPATFTDNLPAFNRAMAAMGASPTNMARRLVADGAYYFSGTLVFTHTIVFEGQGMNAPTAGAISRAQPGTWLAFPANCDGIFLQASFDVQQPAGDQTILRNMTISCVQTRPDYAWPPAPPGSYNPQSKPPLGQTGNGIHANVPFIAERVTVDNFGGHGILLSGGDPPAEPGDVIGSAIRDCTLGNCGGDGIHLVGNNANSIVTSCCNFTANWGWGLADQGLGGNTHIGHVAQGNMGAAPDGLPLFLTDRMNRDYYCSDPIVPIVTPPAPQPTGGNPSTFVGCYTEAAINDVRFSASVIGGILASSPMADPPVPFGRGFSLYAGILNNAPMYYQFYGATDYVTYQFGDDADPLAAFSTEAFVGGQHQDFLIFRYDNFTKYFRWYTGNSEYNTVMGIPAAPAQLRAAAAWFPNGLLLGANVERCVFRAEPAPPTTDPIGLHGQSYEIGDVVWNVAPAIGAPLGWVCTTPGTLSTLNSGSTTGTVVDASHLSVSSLTGLLVGQYLAFTGAVYQVTAIDTGTSTLTVSPATLAGGPAALAYSQPSFSTFGVVNGVEDPATGVVGAIERVAMASKSAAYQIVSGDFHIDCTVGGINITLPSSPVDGESYEIKDANGNAGVSAINVIGATGGTGKNFEDNTASKTISTNYGFMRVRYSANIGKWMRVGTA